MICFLGLFSEFFVAVCYIACNLVWSLSLLFTTITYQSNKREDKKDKLKYVYAYTATRNQTKGEIRQKVEIEMSL